MAELRLENQMDLVVVLNEFASVFREIADKDYISARSNYRLRLCEQFFWAGLPGARKVPEGHSAIQREEGSRVPQS